MDFNTLQNLRKFRLSKSKAFTDGKLTLKYPNPDYWIFNRVISDISVVLRETTLTISDSTETGSSVEVEVVRVCRRQFEF